MESANDGGTPSPATPKASWLAPLPPAPDLPTGPEPQKIVEDAPVADRSVLDQFAPPKTAEAATRQAVQLFQEYQAEKEYLPRVEIIYRLADASSPQSREMLTRLFFSERDPDLRVQMVSALPFVDAGDLNLSLPILQEALKPTQPRELREAAVDTIQSLHDPKATPLLLPLLTDPDPELRETVRQTVEYFREVEQLNQR